MQTANKMDWAKLLTEATTEPGKVSEAYRRFHRYSLGNALWATMQCIQRGIATGPLASFHRWKDLGRTVTKGQKAISLFMPITRQHKQIDDAGTETETSYQFFLLKSHWFVLSQTEGEEYTPDPMPQWSEIRALETLNITKAPFDSMDGNIQGYVKPGRTISVSSIAVQPYKTLFHEVAHVLLGHIEADSLSDREHMVRNVMEVEAESVAMLCCASLELPGVEYSRGYIQSWAEGQPIADKSAQRIFAAADKILKAGIYSHAEGAGISFAKLRVSHLTKWPSNAEDKAGKAFQ